MKLQLSDLKTERQWRAVTGYAKAQFEKLLIVFCASYLELYGKTVAERQAGLEITPSLTSEEELLYFTLFSLKSGLTYDVIGIVCGMDTANAKRNQTLGIEVLQHGLNASGCLPKREFKDAAEFSEYLQQEETVIIDGVEQRIQRPSNDEAQKANYSGKKKGHTVKALIVSNAVKKILYVSYGWAGKTHDYQILKEAFPPQQGWFKNVCVRVDAAFVGFDKLYDCKKLWIPFKKKKGKTLSEEQKSENQSLARARVFVEHAIGGMKRYRILSDRLSVHNTELYNDILGVCAGLWNFYLTN
jgi:hypothetical protein